MKVYSDSFCGWQRKTSMVPRHCAIGADDLMANDYQHDVSLSWKVFDRLVRVERSLELEASANRYAGAAPASLRFLSALFAT
jgi:hypothetical protein